MGKNDSSGFTQASTTPWREQAQYLNPYFAQVFGGATGFKPGEVTSKGDIKVIKNPNAGQPGEPEWIEDPGKMLEKGAPEYRRFLGVDASDQPLPGKLSYFGEKEGFWNPFETAVTSTKGIGGTVIPRTEAPNVVGFASEEKLAQDIIAARARGDTNFQGYDTGYTELIPSAKTALEDIIKGTDRITPASMTAASVGTPSAINKPTIGTPDVFATPKVQRENLDYRFWNPLGAMTNPAGNPELENMIANATRNLRNEHFNYEVPSLDSTAELAGRYGGNRWSKLRTDAYDKYLQNKGQVETTMRGEAYNTDANRALQALNLGGDLAKSQASINERASLADAASEFENLSKRYDTSALAKRLTGELGLTAETSQAGNDLSRYIQDALLKQEAGKTTAGFEQQANVGNIANILQGAPLAPTVAQSDYADIGQLANVGEARSGKAQDVVDAFLNRFNINMLEPYERASLISAALSGNYGGETSARQSGGGGKGGLF